MTAGCARGPAFLTAPAVGRQGCTPARFTAPPPGPLPPPAPPPRRPAITRVCHLWHRLFYEQQKLWQALSIQPPAALARNSNQAEVKQNLKQWRSGKLALVQRVGPLVQAVELEGCFQAPARPGSLVIAEFVDCLEPGTLRSLVIQQHSMPRQLEAAETTAAAVTAGVEGVARHFTGLQTLLLAVQTRVPLSPAAAVALGS